MGSRWKRIAGPAIGLSAVIAALAILAGAPIVLFPEKNGLEAIPAPPGSSEVTQVTARATNSSSGQGGQSTPDLGSAPTGSASAVLVSAPALAGDSFTDGSPFARRPAGEDVDGWAREGTTAGERKKDKNTARGGKAEGHGKSHGNGHAYGHGKSHGNGNAIGHGKSGGGAVASSPHGAKQGHGASSGSDKHPGRSHRPRARSRG